MDQRERFPNIDEVLRAALDGRQSKIQTSMPGIIQSFDAATMTCVVAPAVKGRLADKDGKVSLVALPLLLDCPCQFPSGGGVTLTFPVKEGDECLVVFASRSIDSWYQSGGVQAPVEARMHDLSDGFVHLGFRSKPRVLSNISTSAAQLRSDDGLAYVEVNPDSHLITILGQVQINGSADVSENLTVGNGASGTFMSSDGLTVTVQDGIVTNIY